MIEVRKLVMAEEYERYSKMVFGILEKNDQIDDMVRELSAAFDLPVIITDPCGKTLVDSGAEQFYELLGISGDGEEFWTGLMGEYYAGENPEHEKTEEKVLKKDVGKGVMAASPLLVRGIMSGFCITYHEKRRNACSLNSLITGAVSIGMSWNKQIYGYRDLGTKQMLSRLLLGRDARPDQIPESGGEAFRKYVVCPYVLVVMKTPQDFMKHGNHLHREICHHFDDVLICIEKGEAAILFTRCNSVEKQKKAMLLAEKLTLECGGTAAAADVFQDEKQIWKKRRILERILEIGMKMEPEKHFFTEYEYYMELVCSYAYEQMGAEGYGCQDLDRLAAEDREKGTDFYKSLKAYLLSGNNVNHAAKELFIHRNTMVYRLAKIHEIIGYDINQPDVARRLLLTMTLREFQRGQKE